MISWKPLAKHFNYSTRSQPISESLHCLFSVLVDIILGHIILFKIFKKVFVKTSRHKENNMKFLRKNLKLNITTFHKVQFKREKTNVISSKANNK